MHPLLSSPPPPQGLNTEPSDWMTAPITTQWCQARAVQVLLPLWPAEEQATQTQTAGQMDCQPRPYGSIFPRSRRHVSRNSCSLLMQKLRVPPALSLSL